MAVFSSAAQGHVYRRRADLTACAFANLDRVRFAVEQMVARYSRRSDQSFEQVLAKTRRMRSRQADVFIEVEHLEFSPVNAGRICQCVQKLELRHARRCNDARAPTLGDCAFDGVRGLTGGGLAQLDFVVEDLYHHGSLT